MMSTCDECGRHFTRRSNMLRHKGLKHGEPLSENEDTEDDYIESDVQSDDGASTAEDEKEEGEIDSESEDEQEVGL